jgi:5-methylcytosine-specific restriction protein B
MEQAFFVIRGNTYRLTRDDVIENIKGIHPEPIRKHYVEISGARYPIKQALAQVLGLAVIDFTSQDAYRIFRRLGFYLGQI